MPPEPLKLEFLKSDVDKMKDDEGCPVTVAHAISILIKVNFETENIDKLDDLNSGLIRATAISGGNPYENKNNDTVYGVRLEKKESIWDR